MDVKKILLAEYDAFLINIYAGELRKSGYNISIALDGEGAINRVKSINPDLLILDASLPGTKECPDGFSVLKRLREDEAFKELKVVMLSNYTKEDNPENTSKSILDFGVIKNFAKAEFTAEEIVDEVKRILS